MLIKSLQNISATVKALQFGLPEIIQCCNFRFSTWLACKHIHFCICFPDEVNEYSPNLIKTDVKQARELLHLIKKGAQYIFLLHTTNKKILVY